MGAICPSPPCDNLCSSYTTAASCTCGTSNLNMCGWCASSQKCVYTDPNRGYPNQALGAGDVIGTKCTNAGASSDFQVRSYLQPGAFANCAAQYNDCRSCAAWGYWCTTDNQCHYGNDNGPSPTNGTFCTGSAWIGNLLQCPAVPSTSPVTASPTSAVPTSAPVPAVPLSALGDLTQQQCTSRAPTSCSSSSQCTAVNGCADSFISK